MWLTESTLELQGFLSLSSFHKIYNCLRVTRLKGRIENSFHVVKSIQGFGTKMGKYEGSLHACGE